MVEDECFILFREIRSVGSMLSRERDEDLKALGLTSAQSTILLYLENHPGCQITDLREVLETSHQASRTLVERLKAKGLVEVETSDSDGRARCVYLTPEGRESCASIRRVGMDRSSRALRDLTPTERAELMELLQKVRRNL